MRKRALAVCLTLLCLLAVGGPGLVSAGEASCLLSKSGIESGAPALDLFGGQPMETTGCYISCNTDFNVSCTGSGLFSCGEGVDSGGYYIQCDSIRYYCPPCPTGNPWDCLD